MLAENDSYLWLKEVADQTSKKAVKEASENEQAEVRNTKLHRLEGVKVITRTD